MKKINLSELKEKDKKNALTEIRLLASFNHENIIGYKESFYDEEKKCLYIIMEYCKFGGKFKLLSKLKIILFF